MSGTQSDRVHHETIQERSSKHDWTIKLHRHERLIQVFYFETADVFIRIGDTDYKTKEPAIFFVPPLAVHGFKFPKNIVGHVLSFPTHQILEQSILVDPLIITDQNSNDMQNLVQIIGLLSTTFHAFNPERDAILDHLTQLLLLYLTSSTRTAALTGGQSSDLEMTKEQRLAHALCNLIESSFVTQETVEDYALKLNVSASQLNRVANRVLDATPNKLITKRRMIEAERLLKFTRHTIAEIAVRSGYQDAAYFNRAFNKRHGISPGNFRKRSSNDETNV